MKELLEQVFGCTLEEFTIIRKSLPLYLRDGRQFLNVRISGQSFYIVRFLSSDRFNIKVLKKQLVKYRESMGIYVVYGFPRINAYQRRSLIENGISFVAENGQIYLPFLGSYFEKCSLDESVVTDRFTPVSQLLFLLFLYRNNSYTKTEASKVLDVSAMSITRASKQLLKLGLITEEKYMTEVRMKICCEDRDEYYQLGQKYLINPVQSTMYRENVRIGNNTPAAGEYALLKEYNLGNADYVEYAVYKDYPRVEKWTSVDPSLYDYLNICKYQLWKYDPNLFANRGIVDPVSLICSLRDSEDDRIQMCLDDVKGAIREWLIQEI